MQCTVCSFITHSPLSSTASGQVPQLTGSPRPRGGAHRASSSSIHWLKLTELVFLVLNSSRLFRSGFSISLPGGAGNRRFWLLRALRVHAKAPYNTSSLWRPPGPLNRPGRARTAAEGPGSVPSSPCRRLCGALGTLAFVPSSVRHPRTVVSVPSSVWRPQDARLCAVVCAAPSCRRFRAVVCAAPSGRSPPCRRLCGAPPQTAGRRPRRPTRS